MRLLKYVLVASVLLMPTQWLFAQAEVDCEVLLTDLADQTTQACNALAEGQACYADGKVTATVTSGEVAFAAAGDMVDLADITTLESHSSADSLGVVLLQVATGADPVQLALFGEAHMENLVGASQELVELPVSNGVGYAVNLRDGAGTSFNVAGSFDWNAKGVADGRSGDSRWLHVNLGDLQAWVSTDLAKLEGDISTLAVLDKPYTQAMQSFSLSTGATETPCGAAGLLVQYSGAEPATLQVDGVDLKFGAGTFLLQAQSDAQLMLYALDSQLEVASGGERVTVGAGESAQIALSGLIASAAPQINTTYSFAAVEGLPTTLLAGDNFVCLAGATTPELASLTEPKADASTFSTLDPESHYQVIGWAEDESGERWWRLRDTSWIPESAVQTTSLCAQVGQVEPTVATVGGGGGAAASGGDISSLLADRSIWQANSGQEVSSGTCNFPPLALCQHLVAITPNADGTIAWRGQELQPYTLFAGGDNFYSFSGRNQLNNANLSLALTFQSTDRWTMTMTQVFDNDPECIRTFYYSATRNY